MPLLVAGAPQPTGQTAHPAKGLTPKRVTWTSPTGDVLALCDDGQGYRSLKGRSGFGMVPREVLYDSLPAGGGILRSIHDQVRVLAIPLRVSGLTQDQYLDRYRRLVRSVRHRIGGEDLPGTITVELPNGTRRSISAYYNGGLDAEEDIDDLLQLGQSFPRLEFLALDPYWTGGTVDGQWAASVAGQPWFGTMPRKLSASQVLGTVTVDVPGDADAYPIWKITGPGVPVIGNNTTSRSFQFKSGSPIPAGRTVTVDTRDDQLSVVDDLGNDLYSSLLEFPDLWTLEPGINELQVEIGGATAASKVAFTAGVRWQTGW